MQIKGIIAAVAIALGYFSAASQSLVDDQIASKVESNKIVWIDGRPTTEAQRQAETDSIRSVISTFYYDQFKHFRDPDAPYFLFMSREAGFTLGIGGAVRMRSYYDWGGAMPNTMFAPMQIPIPANLSNMRHFGTTPSGTYVFLRAIGNNKIIGDYQLYVEADFTGYQGLDFRLKKAYAIVGDWTLGYATSTFSDPGAQAPVLDAGGANNKFSATSVLVRYMHAWHQKWYGAVSVETPSVAIEAINPSARPASSWLPDASAFFQYQWERGQHIRLSGIIRSLTYRDLVAQKTRNVAGWGIQLSRVAHPERHLTTYLTANYGRGYAGLGGDLMLGTYDLINNPQTDGQLYAPRSLGWCLGAQYNFRPEIFASVSVSQTRLLPDHPVGPDEYKYGMFACANIFWSITPRFTVATEYDWGVRHNFSGAHRRAQRANLSAMFTF
ncbi:MAG: hypothetical protein K2M61_05810 [Muribaculaceae bacterium]|nr:hypothetical protein [Muribaculaceae bacterium]